MKPEKTSRVPETELRAFRQICEEKRIKLTPQRLEIFHEIMKADDHPSAEDIYSRIKDRLPSVSIDTVYRTLSTFENCGLIARLQTFDKILFDPNTKLHHHLYCKSCKRITDFCWDDFDALPPPDDVREWGAPETRQVRINGVCSECSHDNHKS